jgi:hypothetical protein
MTKFPKKSWRRSPLGFAAVLLSGQADRHPERAEEVRTEAGSQKARRQEGQVSICRIIFGSGFSDVTFHRDKITVFFSL